jgi:hypothetical protein
MANLIEKGSSRSATASKVKGLDSGATAEGLLVALAAGMSFAHAPTTLCGRLILSLLTFYPMWWWWGDAKRWLRPS